MSTKFKAIFRAICLLFMLTSIQPVYGENFDITVTIKGFRNDKGQVLLALHDKANAFPTKPDMAVQKAIVPIQNKSGLGTSPKTIF